MSGALAVVILIGVIVALWVGLGLISRTIDTGVDLLGWAIGSALRPGAPPAQARRQGELTLTMSGEEVRGRLASAGALDPGNSCLTTSSGVLVQIVTASTQRANRLDMVMLNRQSSLGAGARPVKDVMSRRRTRLLLGLVGCLSMVMLAGASSASALSGTQLLTFGDYGEGTEVSTQYEAQGIIFKDEDGFFPEIRWDGSAYTNPVLSGTFGFGSPITAEFVVPGTTTPATVENLAMDVGFIDEPGSTELVVNRTSGPFTIFANEFGFNHLTLSGGSISGFALQGNEEDPHGFELDNLEYTIPAPPPPPPPPPPAPSCARVVLVDSRGSGEKKGVISPPGEELSIPLINALGPGAVGFKLNPYSADKIFGWFPSNILNNLNGLGAFMHSDDIGAYHASVQEGEKDLAAIIKSQVTGACANKTKIVLIGYSQGAQVTGNVFQGLSKADAKHVAAVVLFGDPLYNHRDHDADVGNRDLDGALGHRDPFKSSSTKILSYCNDKDPICQWRLPTTTLLAKKLSEHKQYWGDSSSPAEQAAGIVAKLITGH